MSIILEYKISKQNYFHGTLKQLLEMVLIERINPEVKTDMAYKVTEKDKRILGGNKLLALN